MSTPAETASLYAALEQVLGRESAETLMEQLPRGGRVATKEDIGALEVTLRGDFDSRFDSIDAQFEKIDTRFDRIDAQFEKIDTRFDRIDAQFEKIDTRFERIDTRFEKIDDRLYDFHETLRSYARTFLVVQTATVFGVAGIVLGITQLL
jgi:archaellum component FlaC